MEIEEIEPQSNDDSPKPSMQPLIEMSQDCIVEWNESQNIDLRDIATPSAGQQGLDGQHLSSIGLDEIRRTLDNRHSHSNSNRKADKDNTEISDNKTRQESSLSHSRSPRKEKEIEAIFSILEDEDRGFDGGSASDAPTQPRENRSSRTEREGTLRTRPQTKSLAARRRRRQREGEPVGNKRKQLRKPSTTAGHCSDVISPLRSISEAKVRAGTTEGAFDNLLKQMSTPQAIHSPLNHAPLNKENTNPQRLQSSLGPPVSGIGLKKMNSEVSTKKCTASPRQSIRTSGSSTIPRLQQNSTNSSNCNSNPSRTGSSQTQKRLDIAPSAEKDTIDEFDDFDFDDTDMACLDSLLSAKSSQKAAETQNITVDGKENQGDQVRSSAEPIGRLTSTSSASTIKYRGGVGEQQTSSMQPQRVNSETTKVSGPSQAAGEQVEECAPGGAADDEFGDFPDFDFEEIDEAIAKREKSLTQEFQDDVLSSDVVRNATSSNMDPVGLSFIRFSRYKVLAVDDDSKKYQKTLSVAEWHADMLKDSKKEKEIHRGCEIEKSATAESQERNAINSPNLCDYKEEGRVQLRGQWYYTLIAPGDVIHICSLGGQYRTDSKVLPIVLQSHPPPGSDEDDLVLIHHPDMLMTPTIISEAVGCPRRAVLKSRNGSTGLSSKSALVGTLRHALFGVCMKERKFDRKFVFYNVRRIIRENAEALVGCGMTTPEVESQLMKTLPSLLEFVKQHATYDPSKKTADAFPSAYVGGHLGNSTGVHFATHTTYSLEEPVVSPELGLKGYVDAVLETTVAEATANNQKMQQTITGLKHSLMALELKTGHNQNSQHAHMGQLSLYTLMLQGRYGTKIDHNIVKTTQSSGKPDPEGASSGGLLLYLNDKGFRPTFVAPEFDEFKMLMANRNVIAGELVKVSKPRGVVLAYENHARDSDERNPRKIKLLDAPPADLPQLLNSDYSCKRCFENRSCMLYAASETEKIDRTGVKKTHGELMSKFAGRLSHEDLAFFRKWDRLIDLEAHASVSSIATAWLQESEHREIHSGETVSNLTFVGVHQNTSGSRVLLRFKRSTPEVFGEEKKDSLAISKGSHVVVSTDGSSFADSQSDPQIEYMNTQRQRKKFRHHMNVVRGYLEVMDGDDILISGKLEDQDRIENIVRKYNQRSDSTNDCNLKFRIDKDNAAVGVGTLRQNLINLFTGDYSRGEKEEPSQIEIARQRLLPRLRKIIVEMKPPTFQRMDDTEMFSQKHSSPGCLPMMLRNEFRDLNEDQQNAVRKVLTSQDYTMIQGLPGTGKTSTLSFVARMLVAQGKRVLVTSYTNTAVDNVVIKLLDKGVGKDDASGLSNIVRVGPRYSCHENVRPFHAADLAADFEERKTKVNRVKMHGTETSTQDLPSSETLQRVMSAARIVCSTVLTVPRSPLLVNQLFDVVIVDEAGQTSQPAIIGALLQAEKFVLVGDHKQLPPLVVSEIAQAGGYGESLLLQLAEKHPLSVAPLTHQYRMCEDICKLSSYLVYGGRLKCGSEKVRNQKLEVRGFPDRLPPAAKDDISLWQWMNLTLDPENPVVFVDTDNIGSKQISQSDESKRERIALEVKQGGRKGGAVTNPTEATLVRYICHGLLSVGVSPESIGMISPFRAQVRLIENDPTVAAWSKKGLELSTIDRYQGRDKAVIIISFVRSNLEGTVGRLLQDKRRLNVALTRAKCKLILIGSAATLKAGSVHLRPLLGRLNKNGQRQLLPRNAIDCYNIP